MHQVGRGGRPAWASRIKVKRDSSVLPSQGSSTCTSTQDSSKEKVEFLKSGVGSLEAWWLHILAWPYLAMIDRGGGDGQAARPPSSTQAFFQPTMHLIHWVSFERLVVCCGWMA